MLGVGRFEVRWLAFASVPCLWLCIATSVWCITAALGRLLCLQVQSKWLLACLLLSTDTPTEYFGPLLLHQGFCLPHIRPAGRCPSDLDGLVDMVNVSVAGVH